jgi:hypothetical protein
MNHQLTWGEYTLDCISGDIIKEEVIYHVELHGKVIGFEIDEGFGYAIIVLTYTDRRDSVITIDNKFLVLENTNYYGRYMENDFVGALFQQRNELFFIKALDYTYEKIYCTIKENCKFVIDYQVVDNHIIVDYINHDNELIREICNNYKEIFTKYNHLFIHDGTWLTVHDISRNIISTVIVMNVNILDTIEKSNINHIILDYNKIKFESDEKYYAVYDNKLEETTVPIKPTYGAKSARKI